MSPIQQMLLGVGAVAKKTYVDDLFSTYLWQGNGSARSINNGIDLSGEGGMAWIKNRSATDYHGLFDTLRGDRKYVQSNAPNSKEVDSASLTAFNNNGFSLGTGNDDMIVNNSNDDFSSWTFRKASGFLDIIEWSGNGANRLINHNLGSVPGMVAVKCLSHSQNWNIWHKSFGFTHSFSFNRDAMPDTGASSTWNSTNPTATQISVGPSVINASGRDYIAYVFAGGDSTSSLARSVDFDGSGDYLLTNSSSDYTMGTGDFTVEGWFKTETYDKTFLQITDSSSGFSTSAANITLWVSSSGYYTFNAGNGEKSTNVKATKNIWEHLAYVRHNGTTSLYVNGLFIGSKADTHNYNGTYVNVGAGYSSSFAYDGKISNFRVVKGTAVYTSSFKPPIKPLTNITNTVLLCCQNSTAAGATVHAGGLTANGNPTTDTDHPFDDSASFVFGENENQNVIKMGKYIGNGSESDGTEVYLGWEPTWLMVKRSNGTGNWGIIDTMRGWHADGHGDVLFPNNTGAEDNGANSALPTSTGFKLHTTNNEWNGNNDTYMYVAIRRSDGYCGKPPEVGSDCFEMDTAASTTPNFDSGFPVDFVSIRTPASNSGWYTGSRLTSGKLLYTNANSAETSHSEMGYYDYNEAYGGGGWWDANVNQAWMWKRNAGMDVVNVIGNDSVRAVAHSLNAVPEMIWGKNRSYADQWRVYHKDAKYYDGSNYATAAASYLGLNETSGVSNSTDHWGNTAPDSASFYLGNDNNMNRNNDNILFILFSSIAGISSVDSYTGTGSNQAITVGFQPRFVLIKAIDQSQDWLVFDTKRGINNSIALNSVSSQSNSGSVSVSSTGFNLIGGGFAYNRNNKKYLYYAHA